MAAFNVRHLALLAVILSAPRGVCAAAHVNPGQPITLDAQSLDGDLATNNIVFRKVRISQGSMSISADQGHGQGQSQARGGKQVAADFDNSMWVFRGNVKILMDTGQLASDDAQIDFLKQQLSKAVANGKPATFEERIEKTGKVAHGHADTIDYDAAKGIVRLVNNAWLSDGQSEVRGDSIKYNVVAQTIVAEGADQESQRVHIVIPPPPSKP